MKRRYPIPRAEVEPRVFVRAADSWMELAARFVVPVREARTAKDAITRNIRERFDGAGIDFAFPTEEVTVTYRDGNGDGRPGPSSSVHLSPSPRPHPPGPGAGQ